MGCLTVKASGSVANFISPTVTPIESARVYFSPTQLGEGTPSPDNVREIVGRTGVELYQCGKNLWKYGDLINKQNNQDYDFTYILMPNQEYTFSAIVESTSPYDTCLIRLEGDGLQEKRIQKSTNEKRTFVTFNSGSKNYNRIRLYAFIAYSQDYYATYKDIQLELGSTATPYEPYQGKTISFSWKRLPDEYQEVEYIESTGTQAILTDIPCQLPLKTDIDVLFTQSNDSYFCGTRYGDVRICSGGNYQNNVQWALGTYKLTNGIALNTRYLLSTFLDNGNQSIAIDGDVVGTYEYTLSESKVTSMNGNLALFAMRINNSQTFGQYAKAKCYGVKISNNNALLGNFIPCYRKSDNEIGMYDTVSQTFYTNQGTGTFTKGDDVTSDVFSDEVYGGYVDLVKGEIVEEYYSVPYTAWRIYKQNNGYICYKAVQPDNLGKWYCNVLNTYGSFSSNAMDRNIIQKHGSTLDLTGTLYMALDENVDISTVQVIYKKAVSTPITHPLPDYLKTQLQTLKNENTFWSDADSVEIDYGLAETFDIQKAKRKIIMNQPHVETLTGDTISFTTDMKAPLKECKVSFMPVQEGSGDPSPSNVRNISGWNGVSVTRCGKNLFGGDALYQSYLANSNNKTVGEDENGKYIYVYNETSGKTLFSDFKPNTQYTFISKIKRPISMSVSGLRVEYIDGTWESALTGNITDGLGYLKWKTNKNKSVKKFHFLQRASGSYYYYENFGIFEGDVNIEDYEPYQGTTYSVDWTDDAGTVYGGYVDLVSGKLVQTYYGYTVDGVNIKANSAYKSESNDIFGAGIVYNTPKGKGSNSYSYPTNIICNKLPVLTSASIHDIPFIYTPTAGVLYTVFYVGKISEHSEITTNADRIDFTNAWLQENPVQLIYELATPITYQLTPQQLITLKGQNNLWADTNGTTEIKFWKH